MADSKRIIETVEEKAELPPCKTAAEMEEVCCEKAGELRCCRVVTPDWDGYTTQEFLDFHGIVLDDQGRDGDGRYVTIEDLPRDTPCGEDETDYDTKPSNCCDEIDDIIIDREMTPDLLPYGQCIHLYWTDGVPPYTLKTTSNGTYFPGGRKIIETTGNSATLCAEETFCGSTALIISDACSSESMTIRSSDGRWEYLGEQCVLPLHTTHYEIGGDVDSRELVVGNLKQVEYLDRNFWCYQNLKCDVVDGIPAELCIPNCEDAVCVALGTIRTDEQAMDTCMSYRPVELYADTYQILCENIDRSIGIVHPSYATTYSCAGGDGSGSGATSLLCGFYLTTDEVHAYRWVC